MSGNFKNIHRREFLSSVAGICLGASAWSETSHQSGELIGSEAPVGHYPHAEATARASYPEQLGDPPSWRLVEQEFHPVSPDRVVVIQPSSVHGGVPQYHRGQVDHPDVFTHVRQRLTQWNPNRATTLSDSRLSLIVHIMSALTGYYHVRERLGAWSLTMAKREMTGCTFCVGSVAVPYGFQWDGVDNTANQPVDWWLFLFPEGVGDWGDPGAKNVSMHAMFLHVFTQPLESSLPLRVHTKDLAIAAALRTSAWVEVSCSNRASAARFANEQILRELPRFGAC